MAKARSCPRAAYLRRLVEQGRVVAARQQASAWLRESYASPQFLSLIAEWLDPSKPDRIRRNRRAPAQWLDIGEAFEALREGGFTREQTILILSNRFHRSARLIDEALSFHREAQRSYAPASKAVNKRGAETEAGVA